MAAAISAGCGRVNSGKRIVRIALGQSESHPEYLGLAAFKEHVEKELGDKYEVQVFPNEILGAAQKAIELTQTGAIDFVVAGTANLETFAPVYEIFSMPYLFDSTEVYRRVMGDEVMMNGIYESTDKAGFRVLTWYNAGTRNFYAKKPVRTPEDLKGMKIRVQQSPASVKMMQAFGAAASPMSFGEVYTAIQQGVIDGAENNELALTNNKHGEVAKYFTYNMHQMVPDMLVGNLKFLESLTAEELKVFREAARISTEVELEEWDRQVKEARETAARDMGVEFLEADVEAFKEKVLGLHREMLEDNPDIEPVYQAIQRVNEEMKERSKEESKEKAGLRLSPGQAARYALEPKPRSGAEAGLAVNRNPWWITEEGSDGEWME
ncbi:MAG: TRAP transporter substrate-binding protein [Hungatella sp.]|nr:TRAP transporter substrate-binding protein [Hungatella sp.]MCI9501006.1 TRAP transporter substrate-binding protein [Hungatella sp.]